MSKDALRQITVTLAVALTIVMNGLANALPLNGQSTGEISDRFKVFFVPAGYVFSIWGLIYLALIVYAIYQALPAQRENERMRNTGWLFVHSCTANIVWLFLWHYEYFVLTVVAMLVLLLLLIAIYLRLGNEKAAFSRLDWWCASLPFSIYLGWVSVATIANITSTLDYLKWGGWGIAPAVWAVIMLVAATALAGVVSVTRRDLAYALVIIWAFAGIAVKQAATPLVANAAWALTVVIALFVIIAFVRRPRLAAAS